VKEVFERVVVVGHQITEITPKPAYAALFAADRDVRFGDSSLCAAPNSSARNYEPVLNPGTGLHFAVPALLLPEAAQRVLDGNAYALPLRLRPDG
jgi:hypothetical protein